MIGEMIVRIVSALLQTAVYWKALKTKDAELATLVLAIHTDRFLLVTVIVSVVVVVSLLRTADDTM